MRCALGCPLLWCVHACTNSVCVCCVLAWACVCGWVACIAIAQCGKPHFWSSTDFYGLNLSLLQPAALADYFSQPVVGYFDPSILLTTHTVTHVIDFQKDTVADLAEIVVPLSFEIQKTGVCAAACCVVWRGCALCAARALLRLRRPPPSHVAHALRWHG